MVVDHEEGSETVVPEFPLIARSESVGAFSWTERSEEEDDDETSRRSGIILLEVKKQTEIAGPLVMVGFLQYGVQMISVIFIGHLGELSLSRATMATSFAGVSGYYILGMASALETFFGQAYGYGAEQHHMLGIQMQRAMLVLMLSCLPISLIWALTAHIFTLCGQDPQISEQAGIYARWLIPSIFPYGLLQCQLRFLQAQTIVKPLIISSIIITLLHVLVSWALIHRFALGNRGAALSVAISYWINALILAVYIRSSSACSKTWTGFSKEGVKDLASFLSLAIPSAFMVCLEYWSYELLVLMSGFLPNPKLETSMMAISFDTSSLVFRIPYGLGSAVSTRVSNELGAGKPRVARLAAQIAISLAAAQGLVVSLTMFSVRNAWGYMYTNEEEVVKYMASVMPVLVISTFMDGIQAALSDFRAAKGIARGCGWQKMAAFVNLGAYYLVGLPLSIILAFVLDLGGNGLWMGIISGTGSQALLILVLTIHTDWEYQARKARERVDSSSGTAMEIEPENRFSSAATVSCEKPYQEAI
ncbi:protein DETOXIFICATION 16-like isoform X2 [Diospyros lotus]|uniref:protein DETOXIFICATION 16-like isoform X2 n=1 Tax=Diospyros lotus TaxID=55363 RepID=UPI002253EC4A|nr:protein DETOXIFICATION 16-like isoform X2 [Diospyros lotus]